MSIQIAYIEDNQDDFDFVQAIASKDKEQKLSFHQFKDLNSFCSLAEQSYDMVLLDLILPDSDSPHETIKKVIGKTNLPIVVLSASVSEGRRFLEEYPELANFLDKGQLSPNNLINTIQGLHGFKNKMQSVVDSKIENYQKTEYERFLNLNRNLAHNLNNQMSSLIALLDRTSFEDGRVDETLDKIKQICSQFVEISSMEIGNKDSINGSSFVTLLKSNVQNVKLNKSMETEMASIKMAIDPLSMQNLFTAIASYFGSNEFQSNVFAEILKHSETEYTLKLVRRNISAQDSQFYETKTLKPGYVSYSVVERLCEIKNIGLKHLTDRSEEVLLLNINVSVDEERIRKDSNVDSVAASRMSKKFDPRTQKLLLMEDNDVLRDVIGENLKRAGYQVLTAADGEIGVKLYEEYKDEIGFVISDVVMPKMNGVNAVNRILSMNSDLPVVFVTGTHLDRGDLDYCDESDYQVIHKPVKTKQLIEILKTYEED